MVNFNDNIYNLLEETDYSATPTGVDVWTGSNPFIGSNKQFPPPALVERANISYTNNKLFENEIQEVFSDVINIYREISPLTGMPIHEIICGLPHFRNVEQYWQALIAGDTPIVEHSDRETSKRLADVISKSNFSEFIATELSSRMRDVISAYSVTPKADGSIHIGKIEAKNFTVYLSAEDAGTVEVILFSNVFEVAQPTEDMKKGKYVQFIEYHRDGLIRETICEYRNKKVGAVLSETEEQAYGGTHPISPVVLFKHNTVGNQVYGTDQYRYMASSVAGALRSLQNLLRLGETLRERLWYGSDKLTSKNPADGSSTFMLNGFAGIPEGIDHQVIPGYVSPKVPITEAVEVFNKCIKSIAMDSKLGMVFFDIEKLGSNLSAKSIIAAMYPAQLEAKRVTQELSRPVIEVVRRIYLAATGELLRAEDLSITWFDGLPVDEKELTETIQSRIGVTLTLEQAISRLDKVSSAVAYDRAKEIRQQEGFISVDDIVGVDEDVEDDEPTTDATVSTISPILTQADDETVVSDRPKFHQGRFERPKLSKDGFLEWQLPFIRIKGRRGER
jgi:hypothetical protein